MQTLTRIVLIAAPVVAVILLFTLLKTTEISTRVSLQNAQIQKQTHDFEKDFANFDNETYWRKKVAKLQKEDEIKKIEKKIQKLQEELERTEKQEKAATESFKEGLEDNSTVNFTDQKLYPKER